MKKENCPEIKDIRAQVRTAAAEGASVEFTFPDSILVYQFPLRDWSDNGLGILIKQDARILDYIRVGQIFSVTLRRGGRSLALEMYQVEIRHISDPGQGQHPGHKVVGLKILERTQI